MVPELKPVFVRDGDDIEIFTVQISISKYFNIRCCVAYGCQETDSIMKKDKFWTYLNNEVKDVFYNDLAFILQFDGNLWAGSEIIPNDPRPQNQNGKMFNKFLEDNPHLTVVNSLPICSGLLTRVRERKGQMEGSVLDFLLFVAKFFHL